MIIIIIKNKLTKLLMTTNCFFTEVSSFILMGTFCFFQIFIKRPFFVVPPGLFARNIGTSSSVYSEAQTQAFSAEIPWDLFLFKAFFKESIGDIHSAFVPIASFICLK